MSDYISGSHPLRLEAQEVMDALISLGGHDRLVQKISDLLALNGLHGGQQITLRNHIAEARSCLPN